MAPVVKQQEMAVPSAEDLVSMSGVLKINVSPFRPSVDSAISPVESPLSELIHEPVRGSFSRSAAIVTVTVPVCEVCSCEF